MAKIIMKTLAILQARMTSTRLPGKVMMKVNGSPMIHWQSKRVLEAKKIDHLIIATSVDESDDSLVDFLNNQGFSVYRGSLDDVFSRYLEISNIYQPASIVRLTGDCPLVMPELIDEMLEEFDKSNEKIHKQFLEEYRKGNWNTAHKLATDMRHSWQSELAHYYDAMIDRILEYKKSPPKNWDGIYRATSK